MVAYLLFLIVLIQYDCEKKCMLVIIKTEKEQEEGGKHK